MHSPKHFGSADARGMPSAVGKFSTAPSTDGQPSGLYVLFFIEMGERFGFYLLVALLALYLDEQRHWPQEHTSLAYGLFIGAAYLTPLAGGLLADRGLGYRRAVLLGAAILAVGYFLVAGTGWLVTSLAVLALGNGLFKPCIASMVGNLYAAGDERRDHGFSIFYMGVNCGALAAPFCGEWLRASWGWSAAFAAAGGAMLLSIAVLVACWPRLASTERQRQGSEGALSGKRSADRLTASEVNRVHALLVLAAVVIFFWLAFQQNGLTLTFWARNSTDRTIHWAWLRWLLRRNEIPTI